MRKLFYISLVVLVLLFGFSCKKDTINPNAAPVISFGSFTTTDANNAVLTFNFSDVNGNNNLGQQQSDTTFDFYMRYYWKNYAGVFVTYYFPVQSITNVADTPLVNKSIVTYHIPYISTNSKSPSINGQISIKLNQYIPEIPQNPLVNWADSLSHFRYEFWIYDRQGHKSNVVTTPEIDINYPL